MTAEPHNEKTLRPKIILIEPEQLPKSVITAPELQ